VIFPRPIRASLFDAVLAAYRAQGATPRIGQEAIQMQTIATLVSAGMGVAWVPESVTRLQAPGRGLPRRWPTPGCTARPAWSGGAMAAAWSRASSPMCKPPRRSSDNPPLAGAPCPQNDSEPSLMLGASPVQPGGAGPRPGADPLVRPDLPGCLRPVHAAGRGPARQPWYADAGWTRRDVEDLLFWGVVGVVLGGRLGYALFYKPGYYAANPLEVLAVWKGGMSFHGGMLGVILAMVGFARSRGRRCSR